MGYARRTLALVWHAAGNSLKAKENLNQALRIIRTEKMTDVANSQLWKTELEKLLEIKNHLAESAIGAR